MIENVDASFIKGSEILKYVDIYRMEIFLGVITICIAFVVHQVISAVAGSAPGKIRKMKAHTSKKTGTDKVKLAFISVGAILGFSVMSHNPIWGVIAGFWGGVAGFGARKIYHWFMNKFTEEKKAGEILILYEIISVYTSNGFTLYEALSAATYMIELNRKPLEKCLMLWAQGPQNAIHIMGEEINTSEGRALAKILIRALNIGSDRISEFLSQESEAMESIRQFRIEKGLGARPLIQTLYLLLPGLALMGVTLLPVGYYISQAIMNVNLK